jgi:hypothetical protein
MVVFFSQWVPSRTTNQDVDEPIITTKLKTNTQEIEVCINCLHQLDTLTKSVNKAFAEVIKE